MFSVQWDKVSHDPTADRPLKRAAKKPAYTSAQQEVFFCSTTCSARS